MTPKKPQEDPQLIEGEWITFPGGELEGRRPKALCQACRAALQRAARTGRPDPTRRSTLCFQCYRAELSRERALRAAGQLDTASTERFQFGLPFEPVNRPRLAMLKAERTLARQASSAGVGRFADRRRRAQISARHVLQSIASGASGRDTRRDDAWLAAAHAAELQFPEAWLPFVVAS